MRGSVPTRYCLLSPVRWGFTRRTHATRRSLGSATGPSPTARKFREGVLHPARRQVDAFFVTLTRPKRAIHRRRCTRTMRSATGCFTGSHRARHQPNRRLGNATFITASGAIHRCSLYARTSTPPVVFLARTPSWGLPTTCPTRGAGPISVIWKLRNTDARATHTDDRSSSGELSVDQEAASGVVCLFP